MLHVELVPLTAKLYVVCGASPLDGQTVCCLWSKSTGRPNCMLPVEQVHWTAKLHVACGASSLDGQTVCCLWS